MIGSGVRNARLSVPERNGSVSDLHVRISSTEDGQLHRAAMFSIRTEEIVGTELNSSRRSEVANPKISVPEFLQRQFCPVDLREDLRLDSGCERHTRGEARHRRFVRTRELELVCERPDGCFAEAGFHERMSNLMFGRGTQARAPVPEVVDVRAGEERNEAPSGRERAEPVVELGLQW